VNSASYRDLLSRYAAEYQPVSPIESLGNAGGYSGARLWRFDSERGRLLLRAWPSHGCGQEHIERVHGWLFATADLRFVPVPVRDRAGRSLQAWNGTLWEVTPWLAGTPDLLCPPGVEHLRSAFTGLALFHERLSPLHAVGLSSGLRQRHDEIRALVSGGFDSLERAVFRDRPQSTGCPWPEIWPRHCSSL
jgi:homoserine kinase type II